MSSYTSKWQSIGIIVCLSGVLSTHVFGQQPAILIANSNTGSIARYNGLTGEYEGLFVSPGSGGLGSGCLTAPTAMVIGPDGHLYVGEGGAADVIRRYDGQSGAPLGDFVSSGDGGLNEPWGMTFGPDGNLYVSSTDTDEVLRYNGATGAFIDVFVATGSGGLDESFGLTFGPDGNLYVCSALTKNILRYNGATGAFIDVFAEPFLGKPVIDLFENVSLEFGPDGNLYVTSAHPGKVVRFNGATGAAIDEFVAEAAGGLEDPLKLGFGPDGDLYVLDFLEDNLLRYDGTTGSFVEAIVTAGSGGLQCPFDFLFTTLPAPSCPPSSPPNVDPISPTKNRYLSFTDGNPGELTAIRVTFDSMPSPFEDFNGVQAYVGEPRQFCESSSHGAAVAPEDCGPAPGLLSRTFWGATLACQPYYADWSQLGTVHVYHEAIIPEGTYSLQAIEATCGLSSQANFSLALQLEGAKWGDVVMDCSTNPCGPPDNSVDVVTDVVSLLKKFQNQIGAPRKARADLGPGILNFKVDITDVLYALGGFTGNSYLFAPSASPPCQ